MIKMQKKVYVNTDKTTLETAFLLSIRLGTTIPFNPQIKVSAYAYCLVNDSTIHFKLGETPDIFFLTYFTSKLLTHFFLLIYSVSPRSQLLLYFCTLFQQLAAFILCFDVSVVYAIHKNCDDQQVLVCM